MTKTQVKSRVRKLNERLQQLRDQFESELESIKDEIMELKDEVEETRDEIEPYEGADDLTPEQEERQDWMDNAADNLQYAYDTLDEIYIDDIESAQSNLEEVA